MDTEALTMATESTAALYKASFIDLVTYRRDGRPVSTPMLSVPRGGKILLRTHHTAGKLKRLRSNTEVEVAPMDWRLRRVAPGTPGTAAILPGEATAECLELLHRRHGLRGRAATWLRHLHGRDVFIEVRLTAGSRA